MHRDISNMGQETKETKLQLVSNVQDKLATDKQYTRNTHKIYYFKLSINFYFYFLRIKKYLHITFKTVHTLFVI